MKKNNKKGFTIVELVIVIAVIAILAAVLIPTFANVISKANESAALQGARNAYTAIMAETDADFSKVDDVDGTSVVDAEDAAIIDLADYIKGIDTATFTAAVADPAAPAKITVTVGDVTAIITAEGVTLG